jgi:hypothetical protein
MEIDFLDRQRQFIPHDNRLISLSRKITLSIRLLRYIVTDLSPHDVILFAPDVITFQAVKSAVFLAKVSLSARIYLREVDMLTISEAVASPNGQRKC